jgi:folate-dependent tRNA-U54 methylase TrmFO/GidA
VQQGYAMQSPQSKFMPGARVNMGQLLKVTYYTGPLLPVSLFSPSCREHRATYYCVVQGNQSKLQGNMVKFCTVRTHIISSALFAHT